MERLLAATIAVIEDKGLAGVTVPEIAAAAGVAAGSVYRRFTDKDALIRAAFLRLLEQSQAANQSGLAPERFAGLTLEQALHLLARALVRQYRSHPRLLKALDQFLDTQSHPEFRDRAGRLIAANAARLVAVLQPYRERILAGDPERAITFALLSATTVIEIQVLHESMLWTRMLPLDDEALASEAARAMIGYLTLPASGA
jgi:AcrR family transcriptional regulator